MLNSIYQVNKAIQFDHKETETKIQIKLHVGIYD